MSAWHLIVFSNFDNIKICDEMHAFKLHLITTELFHLIEKSIEFSMGNSLGLVEGKTEYYIISLLYVI